jgi:hypothetical protein
LFGIAEAQREATICQAWLKEVSFLGHIISEGGIYVDPSKVKDVLSWNTPQNVSDFQACDRITREEQDF